MFKCSEKGCPAEIVIGGVIKGKPYCMRHFKRKAKDKDIFKQNMDAVINGQVVRI